jgi:hypothetical protein
MSIRSAIRTVERRIEQDRPTSLEWIDGAPGVRIAYVRAQRAYWFHVLPYMVTLATILYSLKYLGVALPGFPWSLSLCLAGLALLLCISPYRVGLAAYRAISVSPQDLHFRLRILGLTSFVLATLGVVLSVGFLWAAAGAPWISR